MVVVQLKSVLEITRIMPLHSQNSTRIHYRTAARSSCNPVFLLSLELGRCSSDLFLSSRHVPDWQPRIILLGMVEARVGYCEEHSN